MRTPRASALVLSLLALAACAGGVDGSGEESSGSTPVEAVAGDDAPSTGSGDQDSSTTAAPARGDGDEASGDAQAGDGQAGDGQAGDAASMTTEGPLELPRGGTELFPDFRLVGYVGYPGSNGMGQLGIDDPAAQAAAIEEELADFAGERDMLPVLELIVSIAHPVPGADGTYRTQAPEEMIDEFLQIARDNDAILLLNIQAGAVPFPEEVDDFEKWLVEPDVGVALDPEWAVDPGQVPGEVYGHTTGEELDDVAAYLADLVEEHSLPEKAMVYHQVHPGVVRDEGQLEEHDGVVAIKSVDGIGHPLDKVATYNLVNESTPDHVHGGFKLFLQEDAEFGPIMTAEEVAELDPEVEYLMVE